MSLSSNAETENIDLLHASVDQGINYLDTADLYDKGMSEIAVGKAIKEIRKRSSSLPRSVINGAVMHRLGLESPQRLHSAGC